MRLLFCAIAMLLLVVGCDYFDDNPVKDSTPVILPANADWELIATLQRNPLRPGSFYIFEEQSTAMANAYVDGKHFIFEFGGEHKDAGNPIRHYIIQPEKPFQDKHKSPARVYVEEKEGIKWQTHEYFFESADWWFVPVESVSTVSDDKAIGFTVKFTADIFEARGKWTQAGAYLRTEIGLSDRRFGGIVTAASYISKDTRLRVYVSR